MMLIKKVLSDIKAKSTSHHIGEKRVLISNDETTTAITQIAVTKLKASEEVETHAHHTMEEYFIFRKGVASLIIDNKEIECREDDFIVIPSATPHALKAVTDIEILTIGCATK